MPTEEKPLTPGERNQARIHAMRALEQRYGEKDARGYSRRTYYASIEDDQAAETLMKRWGLSDKSELIRLLLRVALASKLTLEPKTGKAKK